jgi:pantoate--beta-alanine ligase
MRILRTLEEARAYAHAVHAAGERLALVPTMGALHAGHLAITRTARQHAERVVMSIFVNPTQFAPHEDFAAYPRDEAGDFAAAEGAGVDAIFAPDVATMYPAGAATVVAVPAMAQTLCGISRPEHFPGVCTVVCKLFGITGCDVAVFGEKDYQQLAILKRMSIDLNLPVQVIGHPVERDPDGLAMSSRNRYLDARTRQLALGLSAALFGARARFAAGERQVEALRAPAEAEVAAIEGAQLDYLSLVDAESLATLQGAISRPALLAVAVRFGHIRLIDNVVLDPG